MIQSTTNVKKSVGFLQESPNYTDKLSKIPAVSNENYADIKN